MSTESYYAKSKEASRLELLELRPCAIRLVESTAKRLRWGACVLALVLSAGCVRVQQAVPGFAPYVAGRMTCPYCGLRKEQGCPCNPDLWNHGYTPTQWRLMSEIVEIEPMRQEGLPPPLNAPGDVPGGGEFVPGVEVPGGEPRPLNVPEDRPDPPPVQLDMRVTTTAVLPEYFPPTRVQAASYLAHPPREPENRLPAVVP